MWSTRLGGLRTSGRGSGHSAVHLHVGCSSPNCHPGVSGCWTARVGSRLL
ncbi:hypothetical protein ACFFX0_29830 [Citricoccus parietis]|uniref:Uncharacterized protein n=1 Tax=Citricoccus parietis TaxID=592307 RepID=A0ABV5G872_9MICC